MEDENKKPTSGDSKSNGHKSHGGIDLPAIKLAIYVEKKISGRNFIFQEEGYPEDFEFEPEARLEAESFLESISNDPTDRTAQAIAFRTCELAEIIANGGLLFFSDAPTNVQPASACSCVLSSEDISTFFVMSWDEHLRRQNEARAAAMRAQAPAVVDLSGRRPRG